MLWATNHRHSKHLLLRPSRKDSGLPRPRLLLRDPSLRSPGAGGPWGLPGLGGRGGARAQVPDTLRRVGVLRLLRPGAGVGGFRGRVQGLAGHSQASRGPEPEPPRRTRPLLPAQAGAPSGPQRRAPAPPTAPSTARPSSRPESRRPRPPPPAGSGEAAPVRLANGGARTPGAPGRLPREGARRPRGSTLCAGPRPSGAPASRVRSGARAQLAREEAAPAGTRASHQAVPAGAGARSRALRCPEGAVAAS